MAAPKSIPLAMSHLEARRVAPTLHVPSTAETGLVLFPAAVGAGLVLVPTMLLFPKRASLMALGGFVAGALLASSSPPMSLGQEMGLGSAIAAGAWLVERMIGEIRLPSSTGTAAAAAEGPIPPVALPGGAQVSFRRVA